MSEPISDVKANPRLWNGPQQPPDQKMATEGKDGNGKKQKEAKTQKQRTSLRNPGVDTEPIWEVNAASISHGRKQSYYGKSMPLAYPTANSNRQEDGNGKKRKTAT